MTALVPLLPGSDSVAQVDLRLLRLQQMVVDALPATNSKRNYGKALDHLFAFAAGRPLSRELLLTWRAAMETQSPSTVNIRLAAMRSLVREARRISMLSSEDAATLTEIPTSSRLALTKATG